MRFFGALLMACAALSAASPPEIEQLVRQGFEDFYNLDYPQAIDNFEKALALNPSDPELHNHLAQALLYGELYRDGALDSQLVTGNNSFVRRARMEPPPGVERRFLGEIDRAIQLCQQQLANNSQDARALHSLAVAYGLRANWGFLVRKTWMASLSDSSKAHKYDEQVTAIEPANYDARLVQGIYDYIVGSLPWSMRMLGFIAGFHGDKARGIARVGSGAGIRRPRAECGDQEARHRDRRPSRRANGGQARGGVGAATVQMRHGRSPQVLAGRTLATLCDSAETGG